MNYVMKQFSFKHQYCSWFNLHSVKYTCSLKITEYHFALSSQVKTLYEADLEFKFQTKQYAE